MRGKRRLSRTTLWATCAGVLLASRGARASELDPKTGSLGSTEPGAILIGFEDAAQLSTYGVALTKSTKGAAGAPPATTFLDAGGAAISAAELTAHTATDAAVEGKTALLLGKGTTDGATGILVPFAKLAPLLTKPQLRVTVWVRSYGATPLLTATYAQSTLPAAASFTSVTAIRTGRETSDGWAELTTGPIDTAIWGVPLAQLSVGFTSRGTTTPSLVIDALEIVPLDGTPVPANACTIATQDAACGEDGECQFGHCLPAYASWGPIPTQRDRADFVDRWITLAKNVQAARNAAANADAIIAARPKLTAATVGGRAFYTGMIGLVNGLRNHHTSFGSPANVGTLQPLAEGYSSSTLGACLGFGELDLLEAPGATDKQLGFIVYQSAKSPLLGTTLQPGDAVTKIDGIDPLTWVRSVFLTYATGVPADPGADLAWSAANVAWMISHRASTVELTHCASASDCSGANKTVSTIDVTSIPWKNLNGGGLIGNETDPNLLDCVERFQNTLTPASASATGGDTVTSGTVFGDTLALQFDGTDTDFATWEGQVTPAFASNPTKVLFDVRQGNGGYAEDSELIAEEIRDKSQPMGDVGFFVASWDGKDSVSSLLGLVNAASPSCETITSRATAPCDGLVEDYFIGDYFAQTSVEESTVTAFTPGALGARVAWLQAADVSANDYLAAFIQGRPNQRVFAPGPTSGSYGTISSTSALLLGWHGGSIQMSDSLWGTSLADLSTKKFRSGIGVPPDEIVAQKMSDAMNGVDTMLARAQAWLASGTTTMSLTKPTSTLVKLERTGR